jgi:hypothetical protein
MSQCFGRHAAVTTTSWIVCGLGLNVLAAVLFGAGEAPADPGSAMVHALPRLMLLAAGQFCLWRGLRAALGDLWGGLTGRSHRQRSSAKIKTSPGAVQPEYSEPETGFDADEAFARYMSQRDRNESTIKEAQSPPSARPVRAAGGFGRKVI